MDSYSAMLSRTSREFVEELVDGELGEAVELQFEDGVDLLEREDEGGGGGEGHVDAVLGGVEGDAARVRCRGG